MSDDAERDTAEGTPGLRFVTGCEHMDTDWIQRELSQKSYWAEGRTREQVQTIMSTSYCFGAFLGKRQIAYARVLTDLVTIAYLADVWIDEEFRGRGIGRRFIAHVLSDERFAGVRKWLLVTRDAHTFYAPLGFKPLAYPERYMEKVERESW
jgi:GNAT superfamily N-acetyltransferase